METWDVADGATLAARARPTTPLSIVGSVDQGVT